MSFRYLLDTNILSETLKPEPNLQVLTAIKIHKLAITTSAITMQEIIFGYSCLPPSKKRQLIENYVQEIQQTIPILSYNYDAGMWHATERARLKKIGLIPPFIDGQIAAISAVNNLILVTRNVDDFKFFNGLKIENWFD
jgi:tRNA(fMet)-specific endonuclease VapC